VVLHWTTAAEKNVTRYEIEVAKGTDALRQMAFQTLGAVESLGDVVAQRSYMFTDNEPFKNGVRYYRIKIIDNDGTYHYSEVRSVVLPNVITWQIYPNPSKGVFHLVYQAAEGEKIDLQIQDATGRTIRKFNYMTNGFLQKGSIDLTGQPSGVYLLQVHHNGTLQSFKLFKE
jgi:putative heme degradation protein